MLTVKYDADALFSIKTQWTCPICSKTDVYFSVQPMSCSRCQFVLPVFSLLKSQQSERIAFYKGER